MIDSAKPNGHPALEALYDVVLAADLEERKKRFIAWGRHWLLQAMAQASISDEERALISSANLNQEMQVRRDLAAKAVTTMVGERAVHWTRARTDDWTWYAWILAFRSEAQKNGMRLVCP